MKKIFCFAAGLALLLQSVAVQAATFTLSPPAGSYQVGQDFNVNVYVNSDTGFDTVRANLKYSADTLEVKSFSRNTSFSFPSGENGFDNQAGIISYGAGIPGGTTSGSNFGTITFRVKSPGQGSVQLNNDSMILAEGENKYDGKPSSALFSLTPPATPKPTIPASTPQVKAATTQKPAVSKAIPSPSASPILSESPEPTASEGPYAQEAQADTGDQDQQKSSILSWFWWIAAIITLTVLVGAVWYIWKTKK